MAIQDKQGLDVVKGCIQTADLIDEGIRNLRETQNRMNPETTEFGLINEAVHFLIQSESKLLQVMKGLINKPTIP